MEGSFGIVLLRGRFAGAKVGSHFGFGSGIPAPFGGASVLRLRVRLRGTMAVSGCLELTPGEDYGVILQKVDIILYFTPISITEKPAMPDLVGSYRLASETLLRSDLVDFGGQRSVA
jgi:hypothetical protein